MTYVDPTTRITGELITAPIWNQDVVANMQAVYALVAALQGAGYEQVVNTAAQTAVGSFTIPANSLGAYGMVRAEWLLLVYNNTGGAVNNTYEIYLGITQLMTILLALPNAQYREIRLTGLLCNSGATNTQIVGGDVISSASLSAGTPAAVAAHYSYYNTAGIDTTAASILEARVTLGAASANLWAKLVSGVVQGPFYAAS